MDGVWELSHNSLSLKRDTVSLLITHVFFLVLYHFSNPRIFAYGAIIAISFCI